MLGFTHHGLELTVQMPAADVQPAIERSLTGVEVRWTTTMEDDMHLRYAACSASVLGTKTTGALQAASHVAVPRELLV